ncbi:unnamed protein product, partial [Musa hybrid cultivar]
IGWTNVLPCFVPGEDTRSSILSDKYEDPPTPRVGPTINASLYAIHKAVGGDRWVRFAVERLRDERPKLCRPEVPHRRPAGPALRGPRHPVRLWFWSPREPRPARGRHCRRRPHPRLDSGRPIVDWCEDHRVDVETIRANVVGTLTLGDVCRERGLLLVNCATGCIFEYDGAHTLGSGAGFKEEDTPNLVGSFCSKTKAMVCDALIILL